MIHHEYTPHPILNMLITVSLAAVGTSLGTVSGAAIPLIVMQSFQLLAWFSAFVIMLVTLYKTLKEKKENKSIDKDVD
jgi:hypothetical protein